MSDFTTLAKVGGCVGFVISLLSTVVSGFSMISDSSITPLFIVSFVGVVVSALVLYILGRE